MISYVDRQTVERIQMPLTEGLDGDFLMDWQMREVRRAVAYVKERSMFYAEKLRKIDPEKISDFSALEKIPFTYAHDLIINPGAFACVPAKEISRITTLRTSSTTGRPKKLFFTESDVERTVDFFTFGMRPLIRPLDVLRNGKNEEKRPKIAIMLSSDTHNSIADLLRRALRRLDADAVVFGPLAEISCAEVLETCTTFVGAPVELLRMSHTFPAWRPHSVLLSTDYIPQGIVRRIHENWHCAVYTHYGMTETGFGCAVQCTEQEAQHIRHSEILLEIVDPVSGRRLGPGKSGEIVITTFANEAMPLIRYRTGDIGTLHEMACLCGAAFPRLGKVRRASSENEMLSLSDIDDIAFDDSAVLNYSARMDETNQKIVLEIDTCAKIQESTIRRLNALFASQYYSVEYLFRKPTNFSGVQKKRCLEKTAGHCGHNF